MKKPEFKPKIMAMPGFVLMEKYDAWKMLSDIFGHRDWNVMREEFWDMYKSAIIEKEDKPGKKIRRRELTHMFEIVNDLATAAYLLHERTGCKLYYSINVVTAYFPMWERFEYDPYELLFKVFTDYTLDELRGKLWGMYKAALTNTWTYHGRSDKYDMIFLFERLNDLVTAAYVVAREKFDELEKEKQKAKNQNGNKPDTANPGGFISLRK